MRVCFALLLATLAACVDDEGSPRMMCRRQCQSQNDACLVDATSSPEVRTCDARNQRCMAGCP